MLPSQVRRGPQPQQQQQQRPAHGSGGARGPAPMRPMRPGQQAPQYPRNMPPPPPPPAGNLYDGSAYGEPEYAGEHDWPLPTSPELPMDQTYNNARGPSPNNGQRRPPQRPQRPDAPSPVLEPPRQARIAPAAQQFRSMAPPPLPQPTHHGNGQWNGDSYSSPGSMAPQSQHQQGAYGQANKRPPLGPPPSARRGPASYYAQIAPVMPIAEETDSMRGSTRGGSTQGGHDSVRSYASSNAIPIGISHHYLPHQDSVPSLPGAERSIFPHEHDESPIDRGLSPAMMDDGRSSYDDSSRGGLTPEPALVRQASMGRKSKPTLTTVKSGEKIRKASGEGLASLPSGQRGRMPTEDALEKEVGMRKHAEGRLTYNSDTDTYETLQQPRSDNFEKELEAGGVAALAAAAYTKSRENDSQRTRSSEILASGTGLIDPSDSSSASDKSQHDNRSKAQKFLGLVRRSSSRGPSPLALDDNNTRRSQILAGLEKGGAISSLDEKQESDTLKTPGRGLSSRAGKRRPPRLDVDAVRDAEARGSLTSLPDLIVRATRLASNLDRGRTASRLGMDWLGGEGKEEKARRLAAEKEQEKRRSGSISDMLASFPQAGPNGTPPGSRGGDMMGKRRSTGWSSSGLRHEQLASDSDAGRHPRRERERRCCGMPLWGFMLLLLALILLAAAAIIVPVALIVIPRQQDASNNNNGGNSAASKALQQCQRKLTCQNGGVNVLTSAGETCSCICVNGFTGSACVNTSTTGCSSIFVGNTQNTTVGDAIPRLLTAAEANFSIPLDAQSLVGLFNGAGLSCLAENALITFGGGDGTAQKKKKKKKRDVQGGGRAVVGKRQDGSATSSAADGTATSNGIVFETGSAPSPTPSTPSSDSSSSQTSTSSASTSTSTSTPTYSGSGSGTPDPGDFARVAILFVFQSSGQLGAAITAQKNLNDYFSSGGSGGSGNETVALGNGMQADLQNEKLSFSNGTTVGGQ
ncbi:hypothetical protein LTR62_000726 [Meristemomyces frigidus]|uniref:EGF-like domain-containing protein n=1 Tax=Meristemomyces frigidus TaxID=1508187 RepID=A0AAN7T8M0_9PEZI|nr:hypothetical protein LTR62_000726 [Meristemomyces frigidus]